MPAFILFPTQKSTKLIPLKINPLEEQSKKFFTIKPGVSLSNDAKMAVVINQKYELTGEFTGEHNAFLESCTQSFNENSIKLKELDQKISLGLVVAVVGSSLSFLPFVGFFSLLGWGAVAYYASQRGVAYNEYHQSLALLVASCHWTLGGDDETIDTSVAKQPVITSMMAALYPVLTPADVKNLIADDVEQEFVRMQQAYNETQISFFKSTGTPDEQIALGKAHGEVNRAFYGFNKGTASDFLNGLLAIFPDLYNACAKACSHANKQLFSSSAKNA